MNTPMLGQIWDDCGCNERAGTILIHLVPHLDPQLQTGCTWVIDHLPSGVRNGRNRHWWICGQPVARMVRAGSMQLAGAAVTGELPLGLCLMWCARANGP